jgi:hypothetical protein
MIALTRFVCTWCLAASNLSYAFLRSCTSFSPRSSYAAERANISIRGLGFHEGLLASCSFSYSGSIRSQSEAQVFALLSLPLAPKLSPFEGVCAL